MDSWVCQQGFPIVTVERIGERSFKLTQESILKAKDRVERNLEVIRSKTAANSPNSTIFKSDIVNENSNMNKSFASKNDSLWHIPFTYITDQNNTESLVWFNTKGILNIYFKAQHLQLQSC